MKRFEFRLARLARVRRIEEERARAAWQAVEAAARRAEQGVLVREAEVSEVQAALREAQSHPQISPATVLSLDGLLARAQERLVSERQRARRRRAEADSAREPWQRLRTELEGLDRLEEKARSSHKVERDRVEAQELDQLASERAARRSLSPSQAEAPSEFTRYRGSNRR